MAVDESASGSVVRMHSKVEVVHIDGGEMVMEVATSSGMGMPLGLAAPHGWRESASAEAIAERLFFEIAQMDVGDIFQTLITKDLKEGFVIHSNNEVVAAEYEETCFVKGISHCERFAFNRCVTGFGGVGKSTSN